MNINRKFKIKYPFFIVTCSFIAAHLLAWLMPGIFETLNSLAIDQLFKYRYQSKYFRPHYDETIVHVDINNASINQLNQFYLNRSHHAKVISNLSSMKVAFQLYDFIYAAPSNKEEDSSLIKAVADAKTIYFGLAFEMERAGKTKKAILSSSPANLYLEKTKWDVDTKKEASFFYTGNNPLITFTQLASVSRGLGFLNMQPDRDGVFRRIPLLVKYDNAFYPSLPFRVICDYLKVSPDNIAVDPGKNIILKNSQKVNNQKKEDIIIPIDKYGNLTVNFIGPWESIKHYNFADVLNASEDKDELELWTEELSGKIVVVSEVTTGSSDLGPVPTDTNYPLSGVMANVMHSILTKSFLKEPSFLYMISIELMIGIIILILAFRTSATTFSFSSLIIVFGYMGISALLFLYGSLVLNIVRPILMLSIAFISIQILRAVESARIIRETEKAKYLAEHELEIGHQIQSGFFPESLPDQPGWEIAAHFKPARQVAGDFYDVFPLQDGKRVGFVIADICDKGVGAALFMALIRSLIRAFVMQNMNTHLSQDDPNGFDIYNSLEKTILFTNNYLAHTHSQSNMFATVFIGVIDFKSGWLYYINCGHEPPVIVNGSGNSILLKPTGTAIGIMPDLDFIHNKIQINPNDVFFAYTDGVTDAQNHNGDFFSKERLLSVLKSETNSAEDLINLICKKVYDHISQTEQFDDVTMIAIKRKGLPYPRSLPPAGETPRYLDNG